MYLLTATLKRFEAEGEKAEDRVYVQWLGDYALNEIQKAYEEISQNIDRSAVGLFFAYPVGCFMRMNALAKAPNDRYSKALAAKLVLDSDERDTLTDGIYIPQNKKEALGRLEYAFKLSRQANEIAAKVKIELKAKRLHKGAALYEDALSAGVISKAEHSLITKAKKVKEETIMVDDFSMKDYLQRK
jgi:acyl-CoA dehydrogenase